MIRAATAFGEAVCRSDRADDYGLVAPSHSVMPPKILSLRTLRRVGIGGDVRFDLVAGVMQKRRVREGWFVGGATVIVSSEGVVRYAVAKHLGSKRRLKAQRNLLRTQKKDVRDAAWAERSIVSARLQRHIHQG